jgi:hypothetical protein
LVWFAFARMADAGMAIAQSSSGRTYEDAIVAMNSLITRKADMPPPDPRTGELNWNAHFQALFHCLEVRPLPILIIHPSYLSL